MSETVSVAVAIRWLGGNNVKENNPEPKVLFYDIETSLMPVAVFQLANNDWIDPSNLLGDRYIICASWKWQGEKVIHAVSVLDDPKRYKENPHDDTHVIKVLHEVLSKADVVVGHNSDSFDKRYVDTRILKHGLSPLPPVVQVDTYKIAKQKFLFASNKLDFIGKYLGLGQKIKTSPKLWLRVMAGDKEAVLEMVRYNKQDVNLLEQVYEKLKPYIPNMLNRSLVGANEGCPRCGSKKIQSRGVHKAISRVYRRFQCIGCGGWFRAAVNEKDVKPETKLI
jgi:DNA polymerase elongation subunit (family B)